MKENFSLSNPYVALMYGEFKPWSFDEKAVENKGLWRTDIFKCDSEKAIDLEIGTGNGTHFAQLTENYPERYFIGLELKYKTLVQSIRRTLNAGCKNARVARIEAEKVLELFEPEEINNVYIHFPDPWPKKRHIKNRLMQTEFLKNLYQVMRPGSYVEFKTDHYDYFEWAMPYISRSAFEIEFYSEDLHNSFQASKNFVTHFESLFLRKRQPIFYCRFKKN